MAELKPLAIAGQLSRVVLLSDGQANVGETDPETLAAQAKQANAAHVTTTTFGLGHQFNEVLMAAMADAGQGRHYYGQTAADLQSAFEEEFALLEALHAREITLALVPGPGVLIELRSADGRADAPVALADLAYGAETWLFVRLHIAAQRDPEPPLFSLRAHDRMSRRLAASGEAAYQGLAVESAKPAYVRRKPVQGKGSLSRPNPGFAALNPGYERAKAARRTARSGPPRG